LKGLHIHNNCDSVDLRQLATTMDLLESDLGSLLERLQWVNLGGGYILGEADHSEGAVSKILQLRERYGLTVFLEPGAAFVRSAGTLVASVVDLITTCEPPIAILDASVNHWPEVFEFQFSPDVVEDSEEACFEYSLAGSTCLAGDLFGQYAFSEPLAIGSVVRFANAGAYSIVKSNFFNGINLPSVYLRGDDGRLCVVREYTYHDFIGRQGGPKAHDPH